MHDLGHISSLLWASVCTPLWWKIRLNYLGDEPSLDTPGHIFCPPCSSLHLLGRNLRISSCPFWLVLRTSFNEDLHPYSEPSTYLVPREKVPNTVLPRHPQTLTLKAGLGITVNFYSMGARCPQAGKGFPQGHQADQKQKSGLKYRSPDFQPSPPLSVSSPPIQYTIIDH